MQGGDIRQAVRAFNEAQKSAVTEDDIEFF